MPKRKPKPIPAPTPDVEISTAQNQTLVTAAPLSAMWLQPNAGAISTSLGNLGLFGSAYGLGYANNLWSGGAAPAALLGTDAPLGKHPYSAPPPMGVAMPGLFAGYGKPWPGTYLTYRIMSAHPTLVLVGSIFAGAVLGAEWSFEATDDAPPDAKDVIQKAIERIRVPLMLDCLRSLAMGWSGFEAIYEVNRQGYLVPSRLKYLLPELTEIQVTDKGQIAGLKQGDGVEIGPGKALVYTNDRDGDYYYGRSRHENCRRAWSNWMVDDDNLGRLGSKASSIIPYIGYPNGVGKDANGADQSNFSMAMGVAQGMASGRPVVYPNLATLDEGDLRNIPELAKASLWSIGTIDMGDAGGAQQALLDVLAYRDKLMARGWMIPERAVFEAQTGGIGSSDAGDHGDTGLSNAEIVSRSIIRFVNEQLIDQLLEWNWGPDRRGTVYAQPSPQDPDKLAFFRQLMQSAVGNPQWIGQILGNINPDAWFDGCGLPKKDDKTIEFDKDVIKPPQPTPGAMPPGKGKPNPANPQEQPGQPAQAKDNSNGKEN